MEKITKPIRSLTAPANRLIDVPVDQLKPHPLQHELFPHETDAELEALAQDIEARGLQQPIEITPDNVVISGHRRVEVARRKGQPTIRARVRHDLARLGPVAIEKHFVAENLHRRQLSRLGKARVVCHLVDMTRQENANKDGETRRTMIRRQVGELLGISAREISRLLAVLNAPPEIQSSYEDGSISLVAAGKVASMPPKQRDDIVAAIRAGTSPAAAIWATVSASRVKVNKTGQDQYQELLSRLDQIIVQLVLLADQTGSLGTPSARRAAQLEQFVMVLNRLIEHDRKKTRKSGPSGRQRSKSTTARRSRTPK